MPEWLVITLVVIFGLLVVGGLLMIIEFALYVPGLNKPEPLLGKILDAFDKRRKNK